MGSKRRAVFDALYREYYSSVYYVALDITRDRHTAEDITHDVFLKYYLYTAASEVKSPRAWLKTVCERTAKNHIKKYSKETLSYLDSAEVDFVNYEADPEHIFFEKLWECNVVESSETILKALNNKNVRWYDAVTYVYAMSEERREVADRMGISVNTLDGLLKRAKNWIKKRYRNEFDRIDSK